MLSVQNDSQAILTRGEAQALVDDAAVQDDPVGAILRLQRHWAPESTIPNAGTAEDLAEWLINLIDSYCLTDDVRSYGPKDSDDTGLTQPVD